MNYAFDPDFDPELWRDEWKGADADRERDERAIERVATQTLRDAVVKYVETPADPAVTTPQGPINVGYGSL